MFPIAVQLLIGNVCLHWQIWIAQPCISLKVNVRWSFFCFVSKTLERRSLSMPTYFIVISSVLPVRRRLFMLMRSKVKVKRQQSRLILAVRRKYQPPWSIVLITRDRPTPRENAISPLRDFPWHRQCRSRKKVDCIYWGYRTFLDRLSPTPSPSTFYHHVYVFRGDVRAIPQATPEISDIPLMPTLIRGSATKVTCLEPRTLDTIKRIVNQLDTWSNIASQKEILRDITKHIIYTRQKQWSDAYHTNLDMCSSG